MRSVLKSIFGVVSLNALAKICIGKYCQMDVLFQSEEPYLEKYRFRQKKKEKRICNEITQCGAEPAKTGAVYFLIYFVIKYLRNSLYQEITEIRYITLSKSIL